MTFDMEILLWKVLEAPMPGTGNSPYSHTILTQLEEIPIHC